MKPYYNDKSKAENMKDYIRLEMKLQKGRSFIKNDFIDAFSKKYPLYKRSGIERTLCRLTVNDNGRELYSPKQGDDILWKIDGHTYRLYDLAADVLCRPSPFGGSGDQAAAKKGRGAR
jgi:hypothetical protein